jgi:hypothetical protein
MQFFTFVLRRGDAKGCTVHFQTCLPVPPFFFFVLSPFGLNTGIRFSLWGFKAEEKIFFVIIFLHGNI